MDGDESYDQNNDDVNNYYEEEVEEDSDKEEVKNDKAGKHPQKAAVQYYKDQPYDVAYEITAEDKTDAAHGKNEEEEEVEVDERDAHRTRDWRNALGDKITNSGDTLKPLPKFDIGEFYNLNVGEDVKDLLKIMHRFSPEQNTLDTKMRPYIPSYVASVGEVDAFIKIARPDAKEEELGLNVIDEPITNGVDPYIFKLMVIDLLKVKVDKFEVKSLPDAQNKPREIQTWIEKVAELRKEKRSNSVEYSNKMPNIETLMQVWPDKMEAILKDIPFPDESLNIPLENYSQIICSMMDIPVHKIQSKKGIIEALHVLFTLYSEFKENQHFQRNKDDNVQTMKFY